MNEDAQHQYAYQQGHDRSKHQPHEANVTPAAVGGVEEDWRCSAAHLTPTIRLYAISLNDLGVVHASLRKVVVK